MSPLSYSAASRRIRETMFGLVNRELVDHWLALWSGDRLPHWRDFDLASVPRHEPGISAFELYPDDRLICIHCGGAVRRSLGLDLTGRDWLAMAVPEERGKRLSGFQAIAAGSVGHCIRYGQHRSGGIVYVEEILLPFEGSHGIRSVLSHIGWRPSEPETDPTPEIRNSRMTPDEVILISLAAEPDIL